MAHYTIVGHDPESPSKKYHDRNSSISESDPFLETSQQSHLPKPFYRQHVKVIVLHSLLCTFNLLFYLAVWQWARRDCPFGAYGPGLIYSKLSDTEEVQQPRYSCIAPALDAIAFETQKWDSTNTFLNNGTVNPNRLHKEFGPPSAELDAAWAELIKNQNIRLEKDELGEYRDTPGLVEIADGSGYYATLSAYHSLHCIKRLHHLMYFDDYYPNKTEQEVMLIKQHGHHCLNILRQTVQCNPDLSILPMQWGATSRIPVGLDEGHHQCVQWNKIDGWMEERHINVFAPGVIVHPLLGEAYPGGKGSDIGVIRGKLLNDKEH